MLAVSLPMGWESQSSTTIPHTVRGWSDVAHATSFASITPVSSKDVIPAAVDNLGAPMHPRAH